MLEKKNSGWQARRPHQEKHFEDEGMDEWFRCFLTAPILNFQEGQELIQEKPELRSVVQQKLEEIRECWSELENTTKAKARQLFDNKPESEVKSYLDLDNQLSNLQQQPPQLEQTHYLPTFSEQLHKTKASLEASVSPVQRCLNRWMI